MPPDLEDRFVTLYERCQDHTMTSLERMYALYKSIDYICRAGVPGAIVECGVWQGGSMMMAALALKDLRQTDRELYLFDTFEGMPPPGANDIEADSGVSAEAILAGEPRSSGYWAVASLDSVRANMAKTRYPKKRTHMIVGRVEDTLPKEAPETISLLRLDTDWYESTAHELEHLYPRLAPGGVLIIDDYGYWRGSRQATDEYFAERPILLNRIDDTGRIAVKPNR